MANDVPVTHEIKRIVDETPTIKSFYLDAPEITESVKPGQFVMVWVPGVDEIPLGASYVKGDEIAVTVKKVGDATAALHKLKEGDYIGARGPYGNGFEIDKRKTRVLVVGGGVGIAPLLPLVEAMPNRVTMVLAAQNKSEIFGEDRMKKRANVVVCTDDGSYGIKGFATQVAEEELRAKKYDEVIACGPEVMLKFLYKITEKHSVAVQFLLERWMKCGFGACGHCAMDESGWMVCKDGPVANERILKTISKELFSYKRDQCAKVVKI